MQMKEYLIESIRQQLNIPKSKDNMWICNVVYSLAGKMTLASLWDHDEDSDHVSPQHFKQRASQIFTAYAAIYPQAANLFPADWSDLIEEIYAIYLRTGHFYRSPYKISPACFAQSAAEKVMLYRGVSPNAKFFMSGLGFYSVHSETADTSSIASAFGLQTQTLSEYLEELLDDDSWVETEWPLDAEFLRLELPFSRGYWQEKPHKDNRISLVRYGNPNKLYSFYRIRENQVLQKAVPEWRIKDIRSDGLNFTNDLSEYRRIAVALLDCYKTLPPIKIKNEGSTVRIQLGYRLPPTEEDFFKLYSWPVNYRPPERGTSRKLEKNFCRRMSVPVYPVFRQCLETIGYQFEEE